MFGLFLLLIFILPIFVLVIPKINLVLQSIQQVFIENEVGLKNISTYIHNIINGLPQEVIAIILISFIFVLILRLFHILS